MQGNINKRRLTDVALVLAAVVFLTWLAFYLRPAVSADTVAFVKLTDVGAAGCPAGCTASSDDSACSSCVARAADLLYAQEGIAWIKLDAASGNLVVAYDSQTTDTGAISETIARSGYDNTVAQTLNLVQYGSTPESRSGKVLRQSPCGGACQKISDKGENK